MGCNLISGFGLVSILSSLATELIETVYYFEYLYVFILKFLFSVFCYIFLSCWWSHNHFINFRTSILLSASGLSEKFLHYVFVVIFRCYLFVCFSVASPKQSENYFSHRFFCIVIFFIYSRQGIKINHLQGNVKEVSHSALNIETKSLCLRKVHVFPTINILLIDNLKFNLFLINRQEVILLCYSSII